MWMATACLTMFLQLTPWYEMFLDIIQYCQVVIRDKMEAALFRQHVRHFSQAMGIPFTTGPVQELLGDLAEKNSGVAF
eukprot:12984042-Ditylum_brightwellii.AAC.1